MNLPSVKTLSKVPGLESKAKEARLLCEQYRDGKFKRPGFHPSFGRADFLNRMSDLMSACGEEGEVNPDIQYVNQGDPYILTVLIFKGRLMVASVGNILERL